MPAIPRQRRYDQVMGDREPKVTDKRFVIELQHRLEDKYLTSECLKEKKLAEAENRRVRKLVLDGIIDAEEIRKGHGAGVKSHDWKEFWPPNPHKTLADYEEERKRKAEDFSRNSLQQDPENAKHEVQQLQETAIPSNGGATIGQLASSSSGGDGSGSGGGTVGRYDATRSPLIDELMAEDNLDELYRKASGIVYVMAVPQRAVGKAKAKH